MKNMNKLLLLVLVLALALFVVGCSSEEQPQQATVEESAETLYWNLELEEYVGAGMDYTSARMPRGDGIYYITFGAKGERVELMCADKAIVNKIDMQPVMGLEFDENGYIIGVKTLEECGYQLFNRMLFVTGVEGNTIHTNNSVTGKGVDFDLTITDETEVRNVIGGALMGYQPRELQVDDEITVITDMEGTVTHVYVKPIPVIGDVYWNTERQYNSTTKMSTREADDLGYFTYVFAINGEQVTLRTRDQKVANAIDAQNAPVMTLEFDEEGLIIKKNSVKVATGGGSIASWFDIIDINGNTVTAERKLSGTRFGEVVELNLRDDCQIYDCTDFADVEGARTELRVGDRIHGQLDSRGRTCIVFVVGNRITGGAIGWNLDRKWDSTNKVSTRQRAADGYYYLKMAVGGKTVTVKTDSKAFVDKIDSFVCYGMKLDENNNVKRVIAAQNIHGNGTYASYYWITKIEGNTITAERDGQTQVIDLHEDFICYDVSDHASERGEVTEPKVGDRIHGFKLNGQLRELYVVDRPWDASIYWNIDRQYDSTNKTTKRVPDENGFYWFDFAVDGKQVTLKTNEKSIADTIDSKSAKHAALLHWNGWITKVISTTSITKYSGGTKSVSWVDVEKIEDGVIYSRKNQSGHADDGKVFVTPMAKSCKVYNVDPDGVLKYVGEPTTVQVGDRIHAYHNAQGLATLIFIVDNRIAPLDTTPNTCPCEQGVTWEPWDGTTELVNKKYYYLTQDVVMPAEGMIISGQTVNLRLDGHTISSPGRCFWIKSDGKLNICDHGTRGKLVGTGVDGESGGVIRLFTATGTAVNLWNIDVVSDGDNTTAAKEGGIASVSGKLAAHNCTFSGGYATDKGGIFQLSIGGTLRLFDCTVKDGYAKNKGGNMNLSGTLYMENTTFSGGKSGGEGDNINGDSALECIVKDSTFIAAPGENNVYLSKAVLNVMGKITITGGTGYNLKTTAGKLVDMGITADSKIGVTRADAGVVMENTTEDKLACFTLENFKNQALVFVDGSIEVESRIIVKTHTDHCLCAGNTIEGTTHTCSTVTGWTEITDAVFEDAIGTKGTSVGLKFIADGNYYLSGDYELEQMICVMPGQNITICLNGCELTSPARISYIAGTLTFTDCDSTGKAVGNSASGGNCLKLLNGGTLNIYGGTFEATKKTSSADGGVIVVSSDSGNVVDNTVKEAATFNLYGGTIRGGKAIKDGGNVAVWHSTSVFNMYGGVIEDGVADELGGGVVTTGTVNLLGGTIRNNDVYCEAGTVTIGGSLKLEALTIKSGRTVAISGKGLTAATPIKLNAAVGVFATNVTTDLSGCFEVADGYTVIYNATDKTLSLTGQAHKTHCLCNGADLGLAPHSCKNISDWQPLTADMLTDYIGTNDKFVGRSVPSGHYYLPEDLKLSSMIIVPAGRDITIDLCGHDITAASTRVSYVAGTLTITDCEGTGTVSGNIAQNGGCIKVLNGGTLNIYGGTFTNPKKDATGGAVVAVSTDAGNTVDNTDKKTSVFNLYGGTLTGGQTSGNGGTVATFVKQCEFNMYGGTITGGSADKVGGCISLNGPSKILGGTVSGGTAGTNGQDISVRSSGSLTLGGNVSIGQIHLTSGRTITLYADGLTVAVPIVIDAASGTIATKVTTDLSDCFKALDSALSVIYDAVGETLQLQ